MQKAVVIQGKQCNLRVSAYTLEEFKDIFGIDLMREKNLSDYSIALKLLYTELFEGGAVDIASAEGYKEWARSLDTLPIDAINAASNLLQVSMVPSVEPKKN